MILRVPHQDAVIARWLPGDEPTYHVSLKERPKVLEHAVDAATAMALSPFDEHPEPENPYTLHSELQESMNDLVGIIRKSEEIAEALDRLTALRERFTRMHVEGHRQYNPGWNLAIDLRNMLLVSECVAKAALMRTESRGGHTRDDHPGMDSSWRKVLLVCRASGGGDDVIPDVTVTREDQVPMRPDLLELFEASELEKYFTEEELADHPGRRG